ncbi:MAG: hypothetical protein Kow00120_14660 [Anaerolineae bacterium]
MEQKPITSGCETCPMRKRAAENPKSLIARIWRWHTGWCPGWKAYKAELAALGLPPPKA